MLRKLLVVLGVGAFSVAGTLAQAESITVEQLEPYPQVSLNAEAGIDVAQNHITIYLAAERSDAQQDKVDKALREVMGAALKQAQQQQVVKVSSGSYQVYPVYNDKSELVEWRGRGEIKLDAADFAAAGRLAEQLSAQMSIASWQFSVSPDELDKQADALIQAAMAQFSKRAALVAESAGFQRYSVKDITIQTPSSGYRPRAMLMRAEKMSLDSAVSESAMQIAGGEERVIVSIQGTIFLQ